MREDWIGLVDSLLRPARTRLAECRAEGERVAAELATARMRAAADCEHRIEALRAEVFAARDGVVTAKMTALEREWRRLARGDRDGDLMTIWARITPPSWLDRKRWRDAPPDAQLEAAILLASDPDGVERAEHALHALHALTNHRIRWRPLGPDFEGMPALVLRDAAVASEIAPDPHVHDAVLARFPDRPHLARAVALAARVDARHCYDLWRTGYVLGPPDDGSITLAFPSA